MQRTALRAALRKRSSNELPELRLLPLPSSEGRAGDADGCVGEDWLLRGEADHLTAAGMRMPMLSGDSPIAGDLGRETTVGSHCGLATAPCEGSDVGCAMSS